MNRLTGSSAFAVEVEALRATAAASAERIKALEARVAELEDVTHRVKYPRLRRLDGVGGRARVVLTKYEEPTDEDRYGWGGQG